MNERKCVTKESKEKAAPNFYGYYPTSAHQNKRPHTHTHSSTYRPIYACCGPSPGDHFRINLDKMNETPTRRTLPDVR